MKKSLSVLLASALSSMFLVIASPASAATVTGILPSKLEVTSGGLDFTNDKPLLSNLVDVSNRGLIDGNQYVSPVSPTVNFIQLTFGPFAPGNSNRIPDGQCLSSLTLSVTADLTGNGMLFYYWNKARMSVGKSESVVRSTDSNATKSEKVGQQLQYSQLEGSASAWGSTRIYKSAISETSGDVTRTHDIGIEDLSTKDLNDGNFVVTVSAINETDILKNVSLNYVSTNVGCKTPVTISSVADSKVFDDSTSPSIGKSPVVSDGTLAAGDELDPATCVQTFNTKTIGTDKGLGVNRGCKILNNTNPSAPVDNTSNYEISWGAALGTISSASVPPSNGSNGSSGSGVSSVSYRSVFFDSNGGTGTTPAVSNYTTTALPAHSLAKPGFVFTSWNTKADGTGIAYADKATYTFDADVTLYAQWVPVKAAAKVKQYVSTFAGDKAALTPKMREIIAGWVKKLPKDSVITCQGSTSGSKVTAFDRRLASNRAKNVCAEAVKKRSDLTYSIQLNPSSATKVSARHVWMIQN